MLRPRDFLLMLLLFAAVLGALLVPRGRRDGHGSLPATAGIKTADPDTDITGVVVDTRGRPVAGALITTDYRIWGRARIPGPDWVRAEVEGPDTITARDGTFILEVGHGEIVDLCIRPQDLGEAKRCWRRPGDHLRVVVTDGADLEITVSDGTGAPIEDARVFILGVMPFRAPMHFHSGVTDARGVYRYDRLTAGSVEIQVVASGWRMAEPVRLAIPGSGMASATVRMIRGDPEPPPARETISFKGEVSDPSGARIEGARVVCGERCLRTNEHGRFRMPPVPVSDAFVTIWIPGQGRILDGLITPAAWAGYVLTDGRTVRGRGPAGAVIELGRRPGTQEIAIVDDRGTFRFADVAPGRWIVTLLHPDADSIRREIVVGEEDVRINLTK